MWVRADWLAVLTSSFFALAPIAAHAQEPADQQLDQVQEPAEEPAAEPAPEPMPEVPAHPPAAAAHPQAPAPLLHGTLELSLQDAIRMGLENNLDVQIERYAPMIADLDVSVALGAYEPELFSEAFYKDTRLPNASTLSAS